MFKAYKIKKKDPASLGSLMKLMLRRNGLSLGMNTQIVFKAWDELSGVAHYTTNKFFRDGVLYCKLSSSVVRSQLEFRKEEIKARINIYLENDSLYDAKFGYVESIVLK